jgi:hypothetical protein
MKEKMAGGKCMTGVNNDHGGGFCPWIKAQ